jgi:hypothetical protein
MWGRFGDQVDIWPNLLDKYVFFLSFPFSCSCPFLFRFFSCSFSLSFPAADPPVLVVAAMRAKPSSQHI